MTPLYRLCFDGPIEDVDLRSFVEPYYLRSDRFTVDEVDHGRLKGLVVTGSTGPVPAPWCDLLTALVGRLVVQTKQNALALLLVRTDKAVYAATYGMGRVILAPGVIDPGFGIEFAVRCLDHDRVTRVRRHLMDARGRTDENSASAGEHIRGFGIEQFGEIVSQISGKITDIPLTYTKDRKRPAQITGNDRTLKVRLGTTPESLMADLMLIEEVCARSNPLPEFEFIANVRPIDPKSSRARRLDRRFDAMLGEADTDRVALAVPTECRERYEFAETFKVTLAGCSRWPAELDVDELVAGVRHLPSGERLEALRKGRVQMFGDTAGEDPLSRKVHADHWLTAEVSDGADHWFYWQGRWYEIGGNYATVIDQRIADLLTLPASVTLPPWPAGAGHDEGWYNKEVAAQDGYVLLDKDTVRTKRFRGGGLEIADVLGPDGQLVCIKKADKTAALNHLFAQGRVAVETLRYDAAARRKFLDKVDALAPGHPVDSSFRSPTLVYGIMLKDGTTLTPETLFSFAKVSLLHAATSLQGMGVRLEIASISR
ncbi:hypothetical protein A6A25_14210 [Saccharothrix sp. CB00851]|nr:hypothetical protein A6A25_14210 [Saccharothrix sp. CB00851]